MKPDGIQLDIPECLHSTLPSGVASRSHGVSSDPQQLLSGHEEVHWELLLGGGRCFTGELLLQWY